MIKLRFLASISAGYLLFLHTNATAYSIGVGGVPGSEVSSQVVTGVSDAAAARYRTLDQVDVVGTRAAALEQVTPTASRLELSALEVPATIDRIDTQTMTARGFHAVEAAVDSLPGVSSGGTPGDLSEFSMRGFTGEQISVLHNGLSIGPSNMVNRPGNAFNLERIEILKGPGSVLYGQGGIGGSINLVNRVPMLDARNAEVLAAYGRFASSTFGVDGNLPLGDTVAFRGDLSRTESNGFIDRAPAQSLNLTAALRWKPSAIFESQLSVDVLRDRPAPYFGTPLVPMAFAGANAIGGVVNAASGLAIDRRMRDRNYDVEDAVVRSTQYWPQLLSVWRPRDGVTVRHVLSYFHAQRRWINAENFVFDPTTRRIDRDRFFVFHDQQLLGNQLSIGVDGPVFGLRNRFTMGIDYSHLEFTRTRGFPDGDNVDPFAPVPGRFGPLQPRRSPTQWDDTALFVENATDLSGRLILVTGARYDRFWLQRRNYDVQGVLLPATGFTRTYAPFNWRAGLVWQFSDLLTPYLSWSTGQDPAGSNLFLVNAGEDVALSRSHQLEAGLKLSSVARRADATVAVYTIRRDDLLTQVARDQVSNVGSQKSRGVEAEGNVQLLPHWALQANLAYTDAQYGRFADRSNGIDASGHRPPNVPRWIGNLWTSVSAVAGLPLELGGGLRAVGQRYADHANRLSMSRYSTVDVYANYRFDNGWMLTGRVRNLFGKTYAQWADVNYPAQLQLGAPRNYEVSLLARF